MQLKYEAEVDRELPKIPLHTSLGQGVSLVKLVQWIAAHDPADLAKIPYWHLVGQHEAAYYRVNTA